MAEPVDLRIQQANERTLLAWVRTGIGLLAFGFLVARLGIWLRALGGVQTDSPASLVYPAAGVALVLLGVLANVLATLEYLRVRRALLAGRPIVTSPIVGPGVAIAVAIVGLAVGAYLVFGG